MDDQRRIAWRLVPLLFALYVANYLDRTNIAYAVLGMKGDLGLTDSVFGTASGIFFLGYFVLQIPGALLAERWSARRLLACTAITWGMLTALTGLVRTPVELYFARFLLGAAEAGFFPAVIVYLSQWFDEADRAKAMARFMAAIPIGFILGGPIAAAILEVNWLGIAGWRWLFLLEGIPAVLLGVATLRILRDRTDRSRVKGETSFWQALRHPAVFMLTLALFFTYSGGYAFWFWEPTILQRLTGWSVSKVSWFGLLIFGATLPAMMLVSWNSDRTGERRWHFALSQLIAAVALGAWLVFPASNALLVVIFSLIACGTVAYLPVFWTLPASFLSPSAAAAAIGFISCVASVGGFFGPKLIGHLSQHGGFLFMIACWTVASALVLLCPRYNGYESVAPRMVTSSNTTGSKTRNTTKV